MDQATYDSWMRLEFKLVGYLEGVQSFLDRADSYEGTEDDDMVDYYHSRAAEALIRARKTEEFLELSPLINRRTKDVS